MASRATCTGALASVMGAHTQVTRGASTRLLVAIMQQLNKLAQLCQVALGVLGGGAGSVRGGRVGTADSRDREGRAPPAPRERRAWASRCR